MSEARPFASLSSGLLARKGAAKPAMRPQGYNHAHPGLEDLGWDDYGYPGAQPITPAAGLTPALKQAAEPIVVEQQRAIAENFGPAEEQPQPQPQPRLSAGKVSPIVRLPQRSSALPAKAKTAFTLRLDPERHLKLRLACALDNRSAQQIVTEALDTLLSSIPEIEALAGQVPAVANKRRWRLESGR